MLTDSREHTSKKTSSIRAAAAQYVYAQSADARALVLVQQYQQCMPDSSEGLGDTPSYLKTGLPGRNSCDTGCSQ